MVDNVFVADEDDLDGDEDIVVVVVVDDEADVINDSVKDDFDVVSNFEVVFMLVGASGGGDDGILEG